MIIKYSRLLILLLLPALISGASAQIYVETAIVTNFNINTAPVELSSSLDGIHPRIFTEDVDSLHRQNLIASPAELNKSLNAVRPRIFIEDVDSLFGLYLIATPASITVSPAVASVVVGSTQTFTATPKDRFGNPIIVVVMWSSSNTSVGTINASTGGFTAIAEGTSTITVTSGNVSGTATLTTTPTPTSTLSPEVAAWDVNHDGIIQKSEAIAAVVNYFTGGITKANAIAVVLAYFST